MPAFQVTRRNVAIAALVLLVLSIILFGVADQFPKWSIVVQSIAATLLSVAVVSLVSDFFFRQVFLQELLEVVGLEKNVKSEGLISIAVGSGGAIGNRLETATDLLVVVQDPTGFVEHEWQNVVGRAGRYPMRIEVFVPDSRERSGIEALAELTSADSKRMSRRIRDATERIEEQWRKASAKSQLAAGSSLMVRSVRPFPVFDLILINDTTCILNIPPVVSGSTPRHGLRFEFCLPGRGSTTKEWICDRVTDLRQHDDVPLYASNQPTDSAAIPQRQAGMVEGEADGPPSAGQHVKVNDRLGGPT